MIDMPHENRNLGPSMLFITLLPEDALHALMAECGEEPADFNECKPCFAYLISQVREATKKAEETNLDRYLDRYLDLMDLVKEVFRKSRDRFGDL